MEPDYASVHDAKSGRT